MPPLTIRLVVASLLLSSVAFAQDPPPPPPYGYGPPYGYAPPQLQPGRHEHDTGYFRAFLGFGGLSATSNTSPEVHVSGFGAAALGVAVGWAVAPNVVLYGEIMADGISDPDIEVGDVGGKAEGVFVANTGFGAGLAYYFMPANVYLSGTLAASRLAFEDDTNDDNGETRFGPSLSLMLGKEWWVSDNWGLGIAGQLFLGRMSDPDGGPTWRTISGGVVFSATYN